MSPTDIDMCVGDGNVPGSKNGNVIGCHCDNEMRSLEERATSSLEANTKSSVSDLDSDDLISLFKLAVIFTRGNPFDNRKHWRMRREFLEANLKVGCFEKIREVEEDAIDNVAVASVENNEPKTRLIQVAPYETDNAMNIEDLGKEKVYDGIGHPTCITINTDISSNDNYIAKKCEKDDLSTDVLAHSLQITDTIDIAVNQGTNDVLVNELPVDGSLSSSPSPTTTPGLPMSNVPEIAQNDPVVPVLRANNLRWPGVFRKTIRRLLRFFRKNKVGVLPVVAG